MKYGPEWVFQNCKALFIVIFDGRQVCVIESITVRLYSTEMSDSWRKSVPQNIISVHN
jgi:hypothetical protein